MVTSEEPIVKQSARYSIKETSELLGIHRHTLRAYVKAGYIHPMYKKSHSWMGVPRQRFLGSEIIRFWRSFV